MTEGNANTHSSAKPASGIGRPPKLSRKEIVAAAIDLAYRRGLEAVTMRAVAAELDSTAAALYRHVKNREELVDLVRDHVLIERPEVSPTGDWRADLRVYAHSLLKLHVSHPWLATAGPPTTLGPEALTVTETAVTLLDPHPAQRGQKYSAIAVCFELVAGFARNGAAAQALSAEIATPAEPDGGEYALTAIVAAVAGVLDDEELRSQPPL